MIARRRNNYNRLIFDLGLNYQGDIYEKISGQPLIGNNITWDSSMNSYKMIGSGTAGNNIPHNPRVEGLNLLQKDGTPLITPGAPAYRNLSCEMDIYVVNSSSRIYTIIPRLINTSAAVVFFNFYINSSNPYSITSKRWTNVACVCDLENYYFYVDGVLKDTLYIGNLVWEVDNVNTSIILFYSNPTLYMKNIKIYNNA
jgi:hypothetical protein